MASKPTFKTTFEPQNIIRPIYVGGSVGLDQSGEILATCLGEDVQITHISTGRQLATFSGDGEVITALALTPSASHLILCSRSFSMRIYALRLLTGDSMTTVEPQLLRTLKPHTAPVVTCAVDSTGTLLATGAADGVVKVWDIRGGYVTHTFHGHSGIISALLFFETSASEQLESIPEKGKKKGKRKSILGERDQSDSRISADEVSTRSFRLASGAEDGKIRIWDLHKRACISILESHVSVVRALDFSPQEHALISASRDKTMTVWDLGDWKPRKVIPVLETIESAGCLEGGSVCYTGGETGRIRVWEISTGRELTQEQEAGSENEGIVEILYHQGLPYVIAIQADQTFVFYSLQSVRSISSVATIEPLPVLRRITGTYDEVIDLAYVYDGSLLALATNTEDIRIISLSQDYEAQDPAPKYFGADVALLSGHDDIVICIDIDWSGHWLATGAKDNTAKLWRLDPKNDSFTCYATFTGHAESLGAISLPSKSPSKGSAAYNEPLEHPPPFMITGSQDRTVKRWEITTSRSKASKALYTRKAHDRDINALDINHNSTLFASASQDRTVKIWSAEEGEVIGVLRGHRRGVWSVQFAPKDTPIVGEGGAANAAKGLILTGSGDKTVKIWNLSDYTCLRTMEGHTSSVLKVVWLSFPSGENREKRGVQVASAGGDGLVKVWDITSGELECTLDNHEDRVWALAVNPATDTLISGGGDSIITFWADTTAATAAASTAASTARVEQEQQLQNYIHAGSYRSAITLALQLNHPARLLSLFTSVINKRPSEEGSLSGLLAVDEVLRSLSDEQLFILLLRIRDWNANARTSPIAQGLLWVLLKLYPASHFTNMKVRSQGANGGSLKEVLDALSAYTERHYKRMEELVDESYLLEYTLREMDDVAFGDSVVGERHNRPDVDMIMG